MPDFQTAIIRTIIFGTLILTIGTTGLYLVFRSFESKDPSRPVKLLSALILFIFTCCLLLYIVSR